MFLITDNIEVDTIGGIKAKDLVFVNDPEACSVNSDITFLGDVIVNGPLQIDGLINGHSAEYVSFENKYNPFCVSNQYEYYYFHIPRY